MSKVSSIEKSYKDKNVPPKNKYHKGVKYWYKFKNSIVVDVKGYDVIFNIRDKEKDQYEYLIEFKKNKTQSGSNTVYQDLLRNSSTSYHLQYITSNSKSQVPSEKSSKELCKQTGTTELVKLNEEAVVVEELIRECIPAAKSRRLSSFSLHGKHEYRDGVLLRRRRFFAKPVDPMVLAAKVCAVLRRTYEMNEDRKTSFAFW